jgi:hypothetical protein
MRIYWIIYLASFVLENRRATSVDLIYLNRSTYKDINGARASWLCESLPKQNILGLAGLLNSPF